MLTGFDQKTIKRRCNQRLKYEASTSFEFPTNGPIPSARTPESVRCEVGDSREALSLILARSRTLSSASSYIWTECLIFL